MMNVWLFLSICTGLFVFPLLTWGKGTGLTDMYRRLLTLGLCWGSVVVLSLYRLIVYT